MSATYPTPEEIAASIPAKWPAIDRERIARALDLVNSRAVHMAHKDETGNPIPPSWAVLTVPGKKGWYTVRRGSCTCDRQQTRPCVQAPSSRLYFLANHERIIKMNYFQNCHTQEEAKAEYRRLALIHHPDREGGDLRTMQEINSQYAAFIANTAKTSEYKRQAAAHAEGKKTAADYHNMDDIAEELRLKIEAALNIPGINVELCGLWVWLTGETKAHREEIKAIGGFHYAPEKMAWYYPAVPSFNRQRRTMDEIRSMHGSQAFSRTSRPDDDSRIPLPA